LLQKIIDSIPGSAKADCGSSSMDSQWVSRLLNSTAKLRLADRATQVQQNQRRANLVNRLVHLTQNRAFGLPTQQGLRETEEMIQIDSPTITHQHAPARHTGLGPWLLCAALVASAGLGLPLTALAWTIPHWLPLLVGPLMSSDSARQTEQPRRDELPSGPTRPADSTVSSPATPVTSDNAGAEAVGSNPFDAFEFDLFVGPPRRPPDRSPASSQR
jgi:hypothetical protein